MSEGRRAARRQAVFLLYQQDLLRLTPEGAMDRVRDERLAPYAHRLLIGVNKERDNIDELLAPHVAGWSLDRLGVLERAILRCAMYELLWEKEVPRAVAIDEAVVLAKRFCSAEAGAFVNGILGSVVDGGVTAPSGKAPPGEGR